MIIVEKLKNLVQSEDERNTMILRGVKYKAVKNGWVPILNVPTVSLVDFNKSTEKAKKLKLKL